MSQSADKNTNSEASYIPYFVRKISSEVLREVVPDYVKEQSDSSTVASSISELAQRMGAAFLDLLKGVLFVLRAKNHDASNSPIKDIPNIYGYFMVALSNGEISILSQAGIAKTPGNSQVYIIADLIDSPIARIEGELLLQSHFNKDGRQTLTSYSIDIWIDPGFNSWNTQQTNDLGKDSIGLQKTHEAKQRIGRFLQSYLQNRDTLTLNELIQESRQRIIPLVNAAFEGRDLNSESEKNDSIKKLSTQISQHFGLSCAISLRPGSQVFHHHLTLDEQTIGFYQATNSDELSQYSNANGNLEWDCTNPSCSAINPGANNFCDNCGTAKPSIIHKNTRLGRRLLTSDGEELVLDISFSSYGNARVPYDEIAIKCMETLRPYCRGFPALRISDPDNITKFAKILSHEFSDGRHGAVGDFYIIDIRTIDADWMLNTRARVKDQLRGINLAESEIEVSLSAIALRESQLAVARRELDINKQEQTIDLDRDIFQKQNESNYLRNEADSDIEKARILSKREIELDELERGQKRSGRLRDWEDNQEEIIRSRDGEIQDIRHEINLERIVLDEDIAHTRIKNQAERERQIDELNYNRIQTEASINNDKIINEARRHDQIQDSDVEERIARMRASRGLEIAAKEQELDLYRKAQEQSLEHNAINLKNDFELKKLETLARIEREQKALYSQLTPNQILAMQASELADSGAMDALTKLAGSDSDAERLLSAEKEKMYERLLQMQSNTSQVLLDAKAESEKNQIEIMKAALQNAQELNNKINKVTDDSMKNQQAATVRTLETMASVAQAAASGRQNTQWQERKNKNDSQKKGEE
jgi:hypothetical protein